MRIGYTVLEVLPFLKGLPYDDLARAYIHALRPSVVRICRDAVKTDACTWRVTVTVDEHDVIQQIDQEVEVLLGDAYAHGYAVEMDRAARAEEIARTHEASGNR